MRLRSDASYFRPAMCEYADNSNTGMVALSAAISQLRVRQAAVCTSSFPWYHCSTTDLLDSFAFVEYEDRRDADEAYHDMHNKRIGRDDILKIEVRSIESYV